MSSSQGDLHQSQAAPIRDTAISFIVLVTVFYLLRVLARHKQKMGWMWADFYMLLSLIFNLGFETTVLLSVRYGAGKHEELVSESDLRSFIKTDYYALPCIYLVGVIWPKLAILDLYLYLFVRKWMRVTCYVIGTIIVLNATINVPIFIWQCKPFSELWNPVQGGHCDNTHAHFTWSSFANVVTDFVMLLLPLPMIFKLQQSRGTKVGILLTFLVGNMGLVASIFRLVEFYYFGFSATTPDRTYIEKNIIVWSSVELGVYHLCACIISFGSLFQWIVHESRLSFIFPKSFSLHVGATEHDEKGANIPG